MLPFVRRSLPIASGLLALGVVLVLAASVLLPALGAAGLWDPQERQLADRVAPPTDVAAKSDKPKPEPTPSKEEQACIRTQPKDAVARTLTADAMELGRDDIGDSDRGRRLPFALMGLVTVLAAAGIAMRFAGARAGLIAAIVLLSMPLLVLQARMLTTEIGTACGATLLVYGFVALARLGRHSGIAIAALDIAIAIAALVVGRFLGFRGGGMLLGVFVPVGAFAAAGGLGVPSLTAAWRRQPIGRTLPALVATIVALALLFVLIHQLYELRDINKLVDPDDPSPAGKGPARELLGHAVLAEGCWSNALGGVWNANDDIRMVFDSTFEQIAYGTFPWGVLAPVAMLALLRDDDRNARDAGALTLAWAGMAWVASEVFQRKVGFTIYAGFPAIAIAIGVWLDSVLTRRAHGSERDAMPIGMRLVALFFLLAVLTFGLDMRAFPDRLTSLLIGGEALAYPKASKLLFTATKNWPVILGMLVAVPFAISLIAWRDRSHRWSKTVQEMCAWAIAVAMVVTVVLSSFWAFAWHLRLSENLSSKALFETYRSLRQPNDKLVIMGDLGQAPHFYADAKPEMVQTRDAIVKAFAQAERVFAIAPQGELCTLHREMGGKRYFVLDDRNVRSLLLSNKVDGTTDKNPLASMIPHDPPAKIPQKPKGRVVWDNKIELLGWKIPDRMYRGQKVTVTLYYKILAPVNGTWQVLMHFDGPLRFNGDHKPINDRCPTATWQAGDYIVDTHTFTAGGGAAPSARYVLNIGFFTGQNPNFRNMPLSEAPQEIRDEHNRVQIMSVALE